MIGVFSRGRLGNQMFQLAFAHVAAKKLNTSYFIFRSNALHYFECHRNLGFLNGMWIFIFMLRNIFRRSSHTFRYGGMRKLWSELLNVLASKSVVAWPNQVGGDKYLWTNFRDNMMCDGFFQSADYFLGNEMEVRSLFKVKEEFRLIFEKEKADLLERPYVAVHLRRTDYIDFGGDEIGGYDMTLPAAYYHRCLAMIDNLQSYKVVFVSDDMEFAKAEFGSSAQYSFERNNEITDFQILLNAKIVISANSTFSWWAAWLNERTDKIIFAPEYFLGFKVKKDYPAGIRVKDWKWINVGGENE